MSHEANEIFREVTIRLTGEPDIGEAFRSTLLYLRSLFPLDEVFLISWEQTQGDMSLLLRIDADRVLGESTFMMPDMDEELIQLRRQVLKNLPSIFVCRFEDLPEPTLAEETRREKMGEMGLSEDASMLVLGVQHLNAAICFVSNRANAYDENHVRFIEDIKEPFVIALGMAIHIDIVKRKSEGLRDDKEIFQQVTRRVTGKLDIGEALQDTLGYLRTVMPADEILLYRFNENNLGIHMLVRVSERGVVGEPDQLLFLVPDKFIKEGIRPNDSLELPEVFIPNISDYVELNTSFGEFEVPPDASFIAINQRSLFAGLVIMSRRPNVYTQEHVRMLTMLKEPFVIALSNALRYHELRRLKDRLADDNRALLSEIRKAAGDRVVGADRGLRQVMIMVGQVAHTASPVLLLGDTGTGKEVIAVAIHRSSDRASGPLVSLNCGAMPEMLLDSELFGHEKGAFTGATERKRGRFERADGGTLFLDEVAELPPSAQVKLLRVLQTKEFERVGGTHSIHSDVRLIAATHRDLPRMVREGTFREDLWFRLNVFPISIPPLRERPEDIAALAYHFIESKSREMNLAARPPLPDSELEKLTRYDWPGNVRELQNAIERALILSRGEPLSFRMLGGAALSQNEVAEPNTITRDQVRPLDEVVAEHLSRAVEAAGGRISGPAGAASLVGMNPSTFRSKMKKLGLVRIRRGEVRRVEA